MDLIREDIDAASRTGALALHGPAITQSAASLVHASASSLGWRISIDLFASRKNNITPRFFAQFAEPDAEGRDALAQPSWNSSVCSHCCSVHCEVGFAFPPQALIAPTLRKAIADGLRLLLLVPYAPSAAYWPRVTGAALAGDGKPIHVFRNPSSMLEAAGSYRPASLALFALDFAVPMPANLGAVYAAPCGQEHVARPRTS